MNFLVKIKTTEDGDIIESPKWCFIDTACGDSCSLCDGQFFGNSLSDVQYETKEVKKGGITCKKCIDKIKKIKSIKL